MWGSRFGSDDPCELLETGVLRSGVSLQQVFCSRSGDETGGLYLEEQKERLKTKISLFASLIKVPVLSRNKTSTDFSTTKEKLIDISF